MSNWIDINHEEDGVFDSSVDGEPARQESGAELICTRLLPLLRRYPLAQACGLVLSFSVRGPLRTVVWMLKCGADTSSEDENKSKMR